MTQNAQEELLDPSSIIVEVSGECDVRIVSFSIPLIEDSKVLADWPLLEHVRNQHFPGVPWTKVKVWIDALSGKIFYRGPISTPIVKSK